MAVAAVRPLPHHRRRRTRRFASAVTRWRNGRAAQASVLRASSLHRALLALGRAAWAGCWSTRWSSLSGGRDVPPASRAARSRPSNGMRSKLAWTSGPLRRPPLATQSPGQGEALDQAAELRTLRNLRPRDSIGVNLCESVVQRRPSLRPRRTLLSREFAWRVSRWQWIDQKNPVTK
jgi:hypothetical protein